MFQCLQIAENYIAVETLVIIYVLVCYAFSANMKDEEEEYFHRKKKALYLIFIFYRTDNKT